MIMKSRSLLAQVLSVNLLLIAGTFLVALVALDRRLGSAFQGREMFVLGLALVATLLGNWLLLRRRFIPLDRLISSMEQVDLDTPDNQLLACDRIDSAEAHRLEAAINRMLARLEGARRAAGRACHPGAGARAPADRAGSPRRGQPGADRGLAPSPGVDRARAAHAPPRAHRDQAPRGPGDGGAARARAAAPPRRARRPRAITRAAQPGTRLLRPDGDPGGVQHPRPRAASSPPSSSWSCTA